MPNDPAQRPSTTPSTPIFQTFQKEMNQLLDRFRGENPLLRPDAFQGWGEPLFPAIDVAETDDGLEVTVEVPGVEEDKLDASISGEILTIKGEKSASKEDKSKDYHIVERRYGSFRRQVPLGFAPEDGAVDATFKDGVLSLRIAKPPHATSGVQKIQISKS